MVWGELEAKKYFQNQSLKKYSRLTLVSMENSALQKNLISVFQEFFGSIHKIYTLVQRLGTGLSFYEV